MSKKIWNLMFVAGNPKLFNHVRSDPDNPMTRAEALNRFDKRAANGWRVWVEHIQTGKRIAESDVEKNSQDKSVSEQENKKENQPGFLKDWYEAIEKM